MYLFDSFFQTSASNTGSNHIKTFTEKQAQVALETKSKFMLFMFFDNLLVMINKYDLKNKIGTKN